MKNFIVIYHAPAEAIAQMANATEEEKAEGMKPWMAWAEKCGDQLVDLGAPLMGGQKLLPNGDSENSTRNVCGYSILKAENIDGAKDLLKGHPHLGWMDSCDIEVHETAPM
ncbi:hypothetical protein ACFLU5_13675 [Bacteroidota bacterium]